MDTQAIGLKATPKRGRRLPVRVRLHAGNVASPACKAHSKEHASGI